MSIPLQKRPYDLFVSYSHADADRVEPVVEWLTRFAGLKVWYDTSSGSAAQRTSDLLGGGIESARGALFLLSPDWTGSTWCRDEHEVALSERRAHPDFFVVAATISDVQVPTWFRAAQVLDLRTLDTTTAAALLRSLVADPSVRVDSEQDVYYAGPWSTPSRTALSVQRYLCDLGWRLVGDSPDNPRFSDSARRIRSIIATSRGLVAFMPLRGGEPHRTSPWVVEEARTAHQLGHPYVLVAEAGVAVPSELVVDSFGACVLEPGDGVADETFRQTMLAFDDLLTHRPRSDAQAFSFLAGSLLRDRPETEALATVVERVSNMTVVRGEYLRGQHAQQEIVDRIRDAAFMIADVSDDNRNALIETGVARGAGTPVHLLSGVPADGKLTVRFMFRDMEMNWYADPVQKLGLAYRIARQYRRRVLSPAPV